MRKWVHPFTPGPPRRPGFHSHSAPGSAPPRPAGRPGYRSRPRAHAASSIPGLPAGTGTHRCSGRLRGRIRIGGRSCRPAFAEKTFQRPGNLLQDQLHTGDGIVLQFRIAPFGSAHDRVRPCRQQDRHMIQAGGHDGAELVGGEGGNKVEDGWASSRGRNVGDSHFVPRSWNCSNSPQWHLDS